MTESIVWKCSKHTESVLQIQRKWWRNGWVRTRPNLKGMKKPKRKKYYLQNTNISESNCIHSKKCWLVQQKKPNLKKFFSKMIASPKIGWDKIIRGLVSLASRLFTQIQAYTPFWYPIVG